MRHPRALLPLVPLFLIGLPWFAVREAVAQERQLATLQGQVISRAGNPIPETEVTLTGTNTTVLSDSSGRFRLLGITPGLVIVRVRRIGFRGQFLRVTLEPGETRTAEIMLDPGPQLLPELTVEAKEAKPLEFGWTTKYDDFFRRRRLGMPGGTFISADDIKRRTAIHTYELLEQYVPGARVLVHCLGEECTEIQFPRCSRSVGYVEVWVDGKRMARRRGHQEAPQVTSRFLAGSGDAAKERARAAELADALEHISPSEIQFMEVYRGIGSIPAEYSGGCGAIVIWTK